MFITSSYKEDCKYSLHKVKRYSYRQEYSFTSINDTNADYLELDIRDISEAFTTKGFSINKQW